MPVFSAADLPALSWRTRRNRGNRARRRSPRSRRSSRRRRRRCRGPGSRRRPAIARCARSPPPRCTQARPRRPPGVRRPGSRPGGVVRVWCLARARRRTARATSRTAMPISRAAKAPISENAMRTLVANTTPRACSTPVALGRVTLRGSPAISLRPTKRSPAPAAAGSGCAAPRPSGRGSLLRRAAAPRRRWSGRRRAADDGLRAPLAPVEAVEVRQRDEVAAAGLPGQRALLGGGHRSRGVAEYGGRTNRAKWPVTPAMIDGQLELVAAAATPAHAQRRVVNCVIASSWPSRTRRRTISGCRAAALPSTKKVAGTRRSRSTSAICGVHRDPGP